MGRVSIKLDWSEGPFFASVLVYLFGKIRYTVMTGKSFSEYVCMV